MTGNDGDPQTCFWCGPDGPCDGSCEVIDLDMEPGDAEEDDPLALPRFDREYPDDDLVWDDEEEESDDGDAATS